MPSCLNGTDTTATVRTWAPDKNARALAAFDVSSIPGGSTIGSATLNLCAGRADALRFIDVHRVTSAWVETTVTGSIQPTVAATSTATKIRIEYRTRENGLAAERPRLNVNYHRAVSVLADPGGV